jgi:hypothetical protein
MLALGALIYLRSRGSPFLGSPPANAGAPAPTSFVRQPVAPVAVQTQPPPPTSRPVFAQPTLAVFASPTSAPVISDVTLRKEHDSGGYYVVVQGGPEDYNIKYGPISDGTFVLADNDKFAAYVDLNGVVYVMNFHDSTPRQIKKFGKKDLQALAANSTPNYSLSFQVDNINTYRLIIHELDYGDTLYVSIPRNLSE